MKRKKAVNLNLPAVLREVSEAYAEANGRSLSTLVEDLLRRHLESKGINAEVTNDQVAATLADLKRKK
jgi:hypothetical protein